MDFKVNVTPKEKNKPEHTDRETNFNLFLAPFQPQTHLKIETALNTTASCCLILTNSGNHSLDIQVTKQPRAERCVVLNLSKLKVEPGQDAQLIISWTAKQHGTFRDIIQLQDVSNTSCRLIEYNVALTTSTIMNSPSNRQESSFALIDKGEENISNNRTMEWKTPEKCSPSILRARHENLADTSARKIRAFATPVDSEFALSPSPRFRKHDQSEVGNTSAEISESINQTYMAPISPSALETHQLRQETYTGAYMSQDITFINKDLDTGFSEFFTPQDTVLHPDSEFSMMNDLNFAWTNTPARGAAYNSVDISDAQCSTLCSMGNDTPEVVQIEDSYISSENLAPLTEKHRLSPTRPLPEDPFLANTLHRDDKWVANQEVEIKKWLNTLLVPPEHTISDMDTKFLNVDQIWQSCHLKEDASSAETRKAVSTRYHTNQRLNTFRRAASTMLYSEEVTSILSKIDVCVHNGDLVIRQHHDLHKNIGLQKFVLELLLSYNPLWLRIGLEVIYGERIPLASNSDMIQLSKFLLTRFFSDPFIVETHSQLSVLNRRLPTFLPLMNQFILKKFLFLVYFLDYAKTHTLIAHDPCLFQKQAEHKGSKGILLKFSQALLSGVYDVTSVLKPCGYVPVYEQTKLDEYSYAVNDLFLDLRDGVKLCRVTELITGKRHLIAECKIPAMTRLRKVWNVDVALKALTNSGYVISDAITAKYILDGDRAKTVALLCQIMDKFQAPLHCNEAATTIRPDGDRSCAGR